MMTLMEAMEARHSVRSYLPRAIKTNTVSLLKERIEKLNKVSGLNMQLILNEDDGFSGMMAHYGQFKGVRNYIAVVGPADHSLDQKAGYYGEDLVLYAQQLGLNTCWVALTFNKRGVKNNIQMGAGEKLSVVIALGYGVTQGSTHTSKPLDDLCEPAGKPEWFLKGMKAAMLAPTVMNKQNFKVSLTPDGLVNIQHMGGFYSEIDEGILKYSFAAGAAPQRVRFAS